MRAPTTRRRKTSRGCACLSLTPPAYLRLAVGAAAFAVALHFNPPGPWLKPRPSLTHAALVATSSPPTPPPCHPAPWWARAVPLELQDLQPRWAPWLWRRPSANSVGQRAAILGRGSSLSPTRATRARLRLIEKIQGMFGIITPGQGGFRSSSLVFSSHKTQHISRPISGLTPFYDAEITIPPPTLLQQQHS